MRVTVYDIKKTVEKLQRFCADEGTRTPTPLGTRS